MTTTETKKSNPTKKNRRETFLFFLPSEIGQRIDRGLQELGKQIPPLKQATDFVEEKLHLLSEYQYRFPFVTKHKKTGNKRNKKGEILAHLSKKNGAFQKLQAFGTKQVLTPLHQFSERLGHTLNLPTRKDLEKLHQQIRDLDEKIEQIQQHGNSHRSEGRRNHSSTSRHTIPGA